MPLDNARTQVKPKKRNDGKGGEALIQEALKSLERHQRVSWVRLYDSTSAGFGNGGSLIPAQPADFIVMHSGVTSLLEVKSSRDHLSLRDATLRSVFSENQIMGARVWQRAGANALCAFYSLQSRGFELWDMQLITEAYLQPPRQRGLQGEPLGVGQEAVVLLNKFLNSKVH